MEDNKIPKLGQNPAFPDITFEELNNNKVGHYSANPGISKRLYIATQAMNGMLAGKYPINMVNSPTNNDMNGYPEPISICTQAFQFADELLKQENL